MISDTDIILTLDHRMDRDAYAMLERTQVNQNKLLKPLEVILKQFLWTAGAILKHRIESIETPMFSLESKDHITIWGHCEFTDDVIQLGFNHEAWVSFMTLLESQPRFIREHLKQHGLNELTQKVAPRFMKSIPTQVNTSLYGSVLKMNWRDFDSVMIDMENFKPYTLFDQASLATEDGLIKLFHSCCYFLDCLYLIRGRGKQGVKQLKASPFWPDKKAIKRILTVWQPLLLAMHVFETIESNDPSTITYADIARIIKTEKEKAQANG